MIGERKNTYQDTDYGTLTMREFDIDGNNINAFYDAQDNLIFVLDNTLNAQKPNVLLVINPDGDKKWDEILSSDYDVDLETIRPKVDNKYQKLDIEYSGLPVYENLIDAYNAGEDLTEQLNQLAVLRDSASRHSAMMRLTVANETIAKTNATIVKTKETIVRLETRIKTLRSSLSAEKKSIGKVNTKQSASRILKLESQIEATNEKLKRAKKRLESAQRRLEVATVDAELASGLLNRPSVEQKQKTKAENKPVMVAPEYPVQTIKAEDYDEIDDEIKEPDDTDKDYTMEDNNTEEDVVESDVKPLFAEDPQIINDNIAFKPIEFDKPLFADEPKKEEILPVVESLPEPEPDAPLESRPVLESFTPIEAPSFLPEPVAEEATEIVEERPVLETMMPVVEDTEPVVQFDEPWLPEESAAPVLETPVQDEPVMPVASVESVESVEPVAPVAPVPPVVPPVAPITPMVNDFKAPVEVKAGKSRPGLVYYILLLVLIGLSVFTLWLYQKNMMSDSAPVLTASVSETSVLTPAKKDTHVTKKAKKKSAPEPETVATESAEEEPVFFTDAPVATENVEQVESDTDVEPVEVSEQEYVNAPVETAPEVINAVPEHLNTSGAEISDDEGVVSPSEEDILASKPVYEPGAKYDNMFVDEADVQYVSDTETPQEEVFYDENDLYYDNEEAAYQAEIGGF